MYLQIHIQLLDEVMTVLKKMINKIRIISVELEILLK